MQKELIELHYSLPASMNNTGSDELSDLQEQLNALDDRLESYIIRADRVDYAIAVASGILCGIVDSFFVGKLTVSNADIGLSHEQISNRL